MFDSKSINNKSIAFYLLINQICNRSIKNRPILLGLPPTEWRINKNFTLRRNRHGDVDLQSSQDKWTEQLKKVNTSEVTSWGQLDKGLYIYIVHCGLPWKTTIAFLMYYI